MKLTHKWPVAPEGYQNAENALKKVLLNPDVGFYQLPQRPELFEAMAVLAQSWAGQYDQIAVVGIGGSSLGPQVIVEALNLEGLLFFENVDPVHFDRQVKKIKNPKRTAWVFSSKSGNTIETLCLIEALDQIFTAQGSGFGSMGVVISERRSNPLTDWGEKRRFAFLEIPFDVGGRFSVLTAVGLFPALLAGASALDFISGAKRALRDQELIAQLVSLQMQSLQRKENVTVFWYYTSAAITLGRWTQQLWAESLGKQKTRKNQPAPMTSTPVLAMGSVDQHSTLQQMMEGAQDKFYWFFCFESEDQERTLKIQNFAKISLLNNKKMSELFHAQAMATEKALQEQGRQTLKMTYPSLNAEGLGHYFMLMELVVATLAEVLDLNAFDQPGVERGKILTNEILQNKS